MVGTDSLTTMIDGLGVAGWGVEGIRAESCRKIFEIGVRALTLPLY